MAFSGAGSIVGALIVAWLGKFPKMGWTALLVQAAYGILIGAQNDDLTTVANKLGVATQFTALLDTPAEVLA